MDYRDELLTITMEECAEVIQACSKVLRFGPDSEYEGVTSLDSLEKEIGDLYCMLDLLHKHDMFSWTNVEEYAMEKEKKLRKWSTLIWENGYDVT